ncbi:hypothetical protein [Paenibacillus endoradicis]|uniref:hypothetical protein n=1 Tax=Paenibacillus endoradicis TaxID=2972487 RepID=UPI002158D672|nr:hypothetical protein [Paenibacillus endoradicis]MCR8660509.1 hypothetical protein [Paenibacillus endoradicis]
MGSISEKLLQSYCELVALLQEQLSIAKMERFDDQLDQINQLELQKLPHTATINVIRADSSDYDTITQSHLTELTNYIEELQRLNQQLQDIINSWYSDNSISMKQVSSHRRTLQSYGGVNYSDVISYFIDDKK